MAKVFVDIGAHEGETLSVAVEPVWGFDRIWSFEPAPDCWPALARHDDDPRVAVLPFGLWTEDRTLVLHDPGAVGASLVAEKARTDAAAEVEVRDAAAWFASHLAADDEVVVKVNCEGAECDVLDHLLDAGELAKVDELLVHFDVRKIPTLAHREARTRARLDAAGVPYRPAEAILFGPTHSARTRNWLSWYHAGRWSRLRYSVGARAVYAVRRRVWAAREVLRERRAERAEEARS